jgi:uncharacterized protein
MRNGRSRVDNKWQSSNLRSMPNREFGVTQLLGVFEWGPEEVTAVTSFDDFKLKYGGFSVDYHAALHAYLYFAMGGTKLWVKRVFHYLNHTSDIDPLTAAKGTVTLVSGAAGPYGVQNTLRADGLYYGDLALTVQPVAAQSGLAGYFDLLVFHPREIQPIEWIRNVTMDSTSNDYVEDVVNTSARRSNYVKVTDLLASGTVTQRMPAALGSAVALVGGDDGLAALVDADYVGGTAGRTGLYGFQLVNEGNMMLVPDGLSSTVQNAAISYCENYQYKQEKVIYIPETQAGLGYLAAVAQYSALTGSRAKTGMAWPRVRITNPDKTVFGLNNDNIVCGYGGLLAGLICGQSKRYLAQMAVNPSNQDFGWLNDMVVGLEGADDKHEVLDPNVQNYVTDYGINPILFGRHERTGRYGAWFNDCQSGEDVTTELELESIGNQMLCSHLRYRHTAFLERHRTQGNSKRRRGIIQKALIEDNKYWTSLGVFASDSANEAFFVNVDPEGENINNAVVQRQQKLVVKEGFAFASPARFVDLYFTRDNRAVESYMSQAAKAAGIAG